MTSGVLNLADSKFHKECKTLKKNLITLLKQKTGEWWLNWDIEQKNQIAPLWMPCLRKNEVENLFNTSSFLQDIKEEISHMINYWKDVRLIDLKIGEWFDLEGEIFFEAKGGYRLTRGFNLK
jgi:hypothetical protein